MGLKCTSIYKPSIFDPSAGLVSEFQESMCRSYVNFVSHQLLTGWVAHSRPNGCPEMTWGRTLTKALKCRGLPVNFKEWRAIAKDRSERGLRTYSKPVPPSVNWPYRAHGSEDEHCITQKDTQPSAHFLFTISTCAQRTRVPFCPKHWHSGLY